MIVFDAEGVRAHHFGEGGTPTLGACRADLAAALDRITELEAALAAAEGARLATAARFPICAPHRVELTEEAADGWRRLADDQENGRAGTAGFPSG